MIPLLLVDDDVIVRTLLAQRLRAAGYLVATAEDGRAALDLARRFLPAIVLTDWHMPEMTGPELIRALRREPALADVYAILFTSGGDDAADADAVLCKPWSDAALLRCLAAAPVRRTVFPQAPVGAATR